MRAGCQNIRRLRKLERMGEPWLPVETGLEGNSFSVRVDSPERFFRVVREWQGPE